MKKQGSFLLFTFSFLLLFACTEEPPPTLNYKERELVDSLFRKEVDSLRPLYDSLCTARFDSALKRNVDSMMRVRTAEIERYLEKIRKENPQ